MIKDSIKQLQEMRLPSMAAELEVLSSQKDFSKEDPAEILEKIISAEYYAEKSNTIQRHLKQAHLTDSTARLQNINYDPSRKINRRQVEQLITNDYIGSGHNILILGATGCGKSFFGNALGINACEAGYRVIFTRMVELLNSLSVARAEGNISKLLKKFYRIDLLIIDDFLLTDTTSAEQKDLMEIFEYRGRGKSTILCSQCAPEEWHTKLGSGYVADAILDRVTNNAYSIILEGDSQRKKNTNL